MSRTKKPEATPPRATKPTAGEDKALWEHVAASVRPLRGKKAAGRGPEEQQDHAPPAAKPAGKKTPPARIATPQKCTREVGTATSKRSGSISSPAVPAKTAGFDRATQDKLRKGKLDIEGRIDLHGMTQDEAWQALGRFVARAFKQHKRTLLVITGKGRVSTGGGVLRRMLPLWVQSGDLATQVLACTPATIKDGGDGAFYLRLRKHT